MSESSKGLLFDISPEDVDGKRKTRTQKKTATPPAASHAESGGDSFVDPVGYLARVDGHYACDRCGSTTLDLVEIRGPRWAVCCSWFCGHVWLVKPVPGIIDEQDKKETRQDGFRVRGGLFDGQTFEQIEAGGNLWYIESLVTLSKREFLAEAAARWLESRKTA